MWGEGVVDLFFLLTDVVRSTDFTVFKSDEITTKVCVMMLKLKIRARWRPAKSGKRLQQKYIKLEVPKCYDIDIFD